MYGEFINPFCRVGQIMNYQCSQYCLYLKIRKLHLNSQNELVARRNYELIDREV